MVFDCVSFVLRSSSGDAGRCTLQEDLLFAGQQRLTQTTELFPERGANLMLGLCWLHSGGGCAAQQLELSCLVSLQEGDEMPQDWRTLFDTSLFSMDTRLVPQVSKMQLKLARRNGCALSPAVPGHALPGQSMQ